LAHGRRRCDADRLARLDGLQKMRQELELLIVL
jgi:hypothetical protein